MNSATLPAASPNALLAPRALIASPAVGEHVRRIGGVRVGHDVERAGLRRRQRHAVVRTRNGDDTVQRDARVERRCRLLAAASFRRDVVRAGKLHRLIERLAVSDSD